MPPSVASSDIANHSGRRFSAITCALSGSVAMYHCSSKPPATVDTMPSSASLRVISFLNATSLIAPATTPPTTAVMVNMKAVRIASWAKVLEP